MFFYVFYLQVNVLTSTRSSPSEQLRRTVDITSMTLTIVTLVHGCYYDRAPVCLHIDSANL